jgi:MFS family permease
MAHVNFLHNVAHGQTLKGRAGTAAAAAIACVAFMGSTIPSPLYVIYQQEFGFSKITLTLIYAVYVVGNLGALLLFGGTSDVKGRRAVTLVAIGLAALCGFAYLFAAATVWLFIARLLSGLAIGLASGTATAWIAELDPDGDRARATQIMTSSNFSGLALGAALAGLLAQYAPAPLRLSYIIYLVLLAVLAIFVARTQETVEPSGDTSAVQAHLGVPSEIRAQFLAPAVAVFGAMALVGFYAALVPTILSEGLGETSHAVAGGVIFELTSVVAIAIVLTAKVASRPAMLWGLALMPPALVLLVVAQGLGSMPVLLASTAIGGLSAALGYRGSLQVVNKIAPDNRRAAVVSTYFVCGFSGNALPVIGVGVLATLTNPLTASAIFALTIGAFAVIALVLGYRNRDSDA